MTSGQGELAEVSEAVRKFRCEFGVVEVLEPLRVVLWISPIEGPLGLRQRPLTASPVAKPSEGARLHRGEVGGDRCRRYAPGPGAGGTGEIGCLSEPAEEGCLMAHGVEDAGAQQPVVPRLGEAECLDEIPLGQAVEAAVAGHPRGQQGGLGGCGEQRIADHAAE